MTKSRFWTLVRQRPRRWNDADRSGNGDGRLHGSRAIHQRQTGGKTADIYALGVMLYQLLSARLPWNSGESKFTIMEQKKVGGFPSPLTFSSGIPAHVAEAIEKCILPDPLARPATASVLREMLKIPLHSTELKEDMDVVSTGSTTSQRSPTPPPAASAPPLGASKRNQWMMWSAVLGSRRLDTEMGDGGSTSNHDESIASQQSSPSAIQRHRNQAKSIHCSRDYSEPNRCHRVQGMEYFSSSI